MRLNHDTPLFYASTDDGCEGEVERTTLANLAEIVLGGQDLTKLTIFTLEAEAEEYAKRVELLKVARMRIEAMNADNLQEIVDAIAPDKIETTIESINHYCE